MRAPAVLQAAGGSTTSAVLAALTAAAGTLAIVGRRAAWPAAHRLWSNVPALTATLLLMLDAATPLVSSTTSFGTAEPKGSRDHVLRGAVPTVLQSIFAGPALQRAFAHLLLQSCPLQRLLRAALTIAQRGTILGELLRCAHHAVGAALC